MILSQTYEEIDSRHHVIRNRLLDRIGVSRATPITIITAPAGFGKTTLAMQWAQRSADEIVWLSLGQEHNDPECLLRDLASGLMSGHDVAVRTSSDLLRYLAARPKTQPLTVVLDDLHTIENAESFRLISRLVTSRIPGTHWLVTSRIMPRLRLARLRTHGAVREILMDELAFTAQETADVFRLSMGRETSADQIRRLHAFTAGWPTGIRFVLDAAGPEMKRAQPHSAIGALSVEWIDAFIQEEVVDLLPDALRDFALRIGNLPHFDPSFLSDVTGISPEETRRYTGMLEHRFIMTRGRTEGHSLLEVASWIRSSLKRISQTTLPREIRTGVLARSVDHLVHRNRFEVAIHLASEIDDPEARGKTIRQIHVPLVLQDRTVLIRQALELLPVDVIHTHPDLAYSYAYALFHRGDSTALVSHLSKVLPGWWKSPDPVVRGYAMNCRAFVLFRSGDPANALPCYREALNLLPQSHHLERLHAWAGVLETASELGQDDLAAEAMNRAAACTAFLPHHQVTWWMNMHTRWADHHAKRGKIMLADELYDHALRNMPSTFTQHRPFFLYRIAALSLETNDLITAEERISGAIAILDMRALDDWHANAFGLGARIARMRGNLVLADERLQRAREIASRLGTQRDLSHLATIQAAWDIENGDLVSAHAWSEYWQQTGRSWVQVFGQLSPAATLMRLRIDEQRFDEAIEIGDRLIVEGDRRRRVVETITIRIWSAVAHRLAGHGEQANEMLRQALAMREDGSIVRAFITPGYDLAMWRSVPLEPKLRAVLDDLGARLNGPNAFAEPAEAQQIVLTARERDVLDLLAESLSNQEISERLYITERTVKKHVSNLMRKLNSPNRMAVVGAAWELGMLEDEGE